MVTYHGSTRRRKRSGSADAQETEHREDDEEEEEEEEEEERDQIKPSKPRRQHEARRRRGSTKQDQIGTRAAGDEARLRRGCGRGARRRRSDYGSVRVSERDSQLLYLIGEQYAVTLPQLARLIGRRLDTARALRDRWKRARWVDSRPLAVDAPSFVWLTGCGRTLSQSPYRVWEPNPGLVLHIEAVTNVRLLLERELRLGEWECERAVAQRFAQEHGRRSHLPDSILTTNNDKVAIEVELTLKSRARLQAIVDELSLAYDKVWYFAPERLLPTLTELGAAAPFGNLTVRRYPPLAADMSAWRSP